MQVTLQDIYDLYHGRDVDRFLWQREYEDGPDIRKRAKSASYENWLKKAVDIYLGYTFHEAQVSIIPQEVKAVLDPLTLAKEACVHSLLGGYCYIINMPSEDGKTWIPKVYSREELKEENDDLEKYCPEDEIIIKGEPETIIDLEAGTIKQGEVTEPFDPANVIFCTWHPAHLSLVKDAAKTCVKIFNFESVKDYLLLISSVWHLTGPDIMGDDKMPRPYSYIKKTDNFPLEYVMPPTETKVSQLAQEIETLILKVGRTLGIEAEFSEDLGGKFGTGVAKAFSMIDTNSIISSVARFIEQATNQALEQFWKLNTLPGEPVRINLDPFLRPAGNLEKLNELKAIADFINVPYGYIMMKKIAAKLLPEATEEDMAKLEMDIEANGSAGPRNEIYDLQV